MNWNKTKNFLIVLFSLINLYLIIRTSSTVLNFKPATKVNSEAVSDTVNILKKNYGIEIDKDIIPVKTVNLNNIEVENIIYTEKFNSSDINFSLDGSRFFASVKTDGTETKSDIKNEAESFLDKIGIRNGYYKLEFSNSDHKCSAVGTVSNYKIYNNIITFEFNGSQMNVDGQWYIPQTKNVYAHDSSHKMSEITNVLIKAAPEISENNHKSIVKIDYGYCVSIIDSSTVNKSASAVACYVIQTDGDFKYYYDALNGKMINR